MRLAHGYVCIPLALESFLTSSADHHCPWVNNCVGHFNYGYFIRFLFYVDVACTYHLIMVTKRVMNASSTRFWVSALHVFCHCMTLTAAGRALVPGAHIYYTKLYILRTSVTRCRGLQVCRHFRAWMKPKLKSLGSIYHFNALFNNTTTIEGWEKDKVATLVRRGKIQEVTIILLCVLVPLLTRVRLRSSFHM